MSRVFIPHDYQLPAMQWLYDKPRSMLWMPMGGGKSITTLTALDNLSLVEDVYPALVLAPLRVAKTTWPDEIAKWAHLAHLRVSPIIGNAAQRQAALDTPADIYTTNYENLVWLVDQLGDRWPFKTVVADEVTRLKSFRLRQGSKRAGALGRVAHSKVKRFIGLTGTPNPNGLQDLWGQLWFVDKGERLGRTYSAFSDRWFEKGYDGFSLKPRPHAQEEIEARLRDVCLTVDALPVDEPLFNPIYVDLPPKARKQYDDMERHMYAELSAGDIEAVSAAAKTMKCLQLANGAAYTDDRGAWEAVHDAKLEAMDSVLEEANGAPVLVAYHFKSDLARLQKRYPHGRALDARSDVIRDWNAGRVPLLFAHPACLHPATEVLTEHRGWVKIIDVKPHERVFDGVEFVSHSGCHFSGVRGVIDVFGLTLTPDHKLLVGDKWVKAKDVRNNQGAKRDAQYTYAGDDTYLSAMFAMRRGASAGQTALSPGESETESALPFVYRGYISPDDRNTVLGHLERHEKQGVQSERSGLQTIRRSWARALQSVDVIRQFLRRHAPALSGRADAGTHRQQQGLQQAKLPMGHADGAASQQGEQSSGSLSRPRYALDGVLPLSRSWALRDNDASEQRHDSGGGAARLPGVTVPQKPPVSGVYDLVDCGPRNRFLVRNADGEIFVSHNSAGHGLNLAQGGNILAFFSLNWNLEEHMQIIERIGPLRQKQAGLDRPVHVHAIMARRTVDELVLERLRSKRSFQDIMLEAMKEKMR